VFLIWAVLWGFAGKELKLPRYDKVFSLLSSIFPALCQFVPYKMYLEALLHFNDLWSLLLKGLISCEQNQLYGSLNMQVLGYKL